MPVYLMGPSGHRPGSRRVRTQLGPHSQEGPDQARAVQLDRSPHGLLEPVVVEVELGRLDRGQSVEGRHCRVRPRRRQRLGDGADDRRQQRAQGGHSLAELLGRPYRRSPRRRHRRGRCRALPPRWSRWARCWSWPVRRPRSAAPAPARASSRTRGPHRCGSAFGARGSCPPPSRAPTRPPRAGHPPAPPAATSGRAARRPAVPTARRNLQRASSAGSKWATIQRHISTRLECRVELGAWRLV